MTQPGDHDEPDPTAAPAATLLEALAEEFGAGGIACGVVAAEEPIPAQLVVPLEHDLSAHVCFLPFQEDPPVLQYFVALEHDVEPEALATTARFLHLLNTSLPLTGFELGENAGAVVFRYVQPVSVDPLDPAVVAWPLSMIYQAVTRFDDVIGRACTGTPFVELLSHFARVQAEIHAPDPQP